MSQTPFPAAPPVPTRHSLIVASIVATAFFMEMLDSTVIVLALPNMATDFGVNPVDLSLGITAYILTIAVMIPASGWIADRLGARNVFCAAIALFTLASVWCGFSTSLWEFVAARVLQGVGGAMMSPVGRLVVLQSTDRSNLVRVMNFVTAPGLVGAVVGPPIGGFITSTWTWHWIFFMNVPIGVLGIALALYFIAPARPAEKRPFDLRGFVLNGAALGCLLYGLDSIAGHAGDPKLGAALMIVGAMLGVLAVRHARSHAHPIVSLSALRYRSFSSIAFGGGLFRIAVAAPTFLIPLLLQVGLGLSAFISGLLILAHTTGDFAMKSLTRRSIRTFGFRLNMIWTTVIFAASVVACAFFTPTTPLWIMLVVLFLSGLVRSQQMTGQNALQFAELGPTEVTAASTLSSAMMQITRGVGVAFAAVVLNIATAIRGDSAATLSDFRIALIAMAVVCLSSLFWYVPMPRNVGDEISGREKAQ